MKTSMCLFCHLCETFVSGFSSSIVVCASYVSGCASPVIGNSNCTTLFFATWGELFEQLASQMLSNNL